MKDVWPYAPPIASQTRRPGLVRRFLKTPAAIPWILVGIVAIVTAIAVSLCPKENGNIEYAGQPAFAERERDADEHGQIGSRGAAHIRGGEREEGRAGNGKVGDFMDWKLDHPGGSFFMYSLDPDFPLSISGKKWGK